MAIPVRKGKKSMAMCPFSGLYGFGEMKCGVVDSSMCAGCRKTMEDTYKFRNGGNEGLFRKI